ncbi:N-acetylmuramoyl-L-alanine amidase [Nonomuraea sp. NPDC026600]|uniref:peptidoglycan recognition protein family protein n=1 Tax=Nonomuraea sp. NPDC026600 TaxID=3155363 RepID=UPI003405D025
MVDLVSRKEWDARPPELVTRLQHAPAGVKVHYLAGKVSPGLVDDHGLCVDLVQEVQHWHMDDNGWNDTAYSGLVCPHRKVFVGRGPWALPAANGEGLNSEHYALACLLGDKGLTTPPDGMLLGLADGIRWLRCEGGAGDDIAGHRDGYDTGCPGEPLYAVVKRWRREGLPLLPGPVRPPSVPPFARVLAYPPIMRGADVRMWQAQMRHRGWNIAVDGAFGPQSQMIAAEFAERKGIGQAGGRVTWPVWDAAWSLPIT